MVGSDGVGVVVEDVVELEVVGEPDGDVVGSDGLATWMATLWDTS